MRARRLLAAVLAAHCCCVTSPEPVAPAGCATRGPGPARGVVPASAGPPPRSQAASRAPARRSSHDDTVQEMRALQEEWQAGRPGGPDRAAFLRLRDGLLSRVIGPGATEMCCAVCLESTRAPESEGRVALVDGCLHPFCLDCILSWALHSRAKPPGPLPNERGNRARSQSCPPGVTYGLSTSRDTSPAEALCECPLCKQPILRLYVERGGAWRREVKTSILPLFLFLARKNVYD